MPTKDQKQAYTETQRTGHEWDGITEYDNPLPKWWLYIFYATIVFAIGYAVLYPSVPLISTHTKGLLGYNSREQEGDAEAEVQRLQASYRNRLTSLGLPEIRKDPELLAFAETGGRALFNDNCVPCHRAGGAGGKGYPNLADDDWLWGGTLSEIQATIAHGIRNEDAQSHQTSMPRFAADGILNRGQISDVADYVLSLTGHPAPAPILERGKKIFADNCASCHGDDGKGKQDVGSKNLTDDIWLYGGDRASIVETISTARNGSMPSWGLRFDPTTIKMLTLYVYSLGGGQQ